VEAFSKIGSISPVNRYVALLRGINVGGNNMIPMAALKACFEAERLRDVATYIQSGNVLFSAPSTDSTALTTTIERALNKTFGFPVPVVVRSDEQMTAVVKQSPKGFGTRPTEYRYDVFFLKEPLTVDEAMKGMATTPGVDRVWPGKGVVYFSRLVRRAVESQMSRIVGKPIYRSMTIRNWNTTRKLAELMAASCARPSP
jgi:uncharacterized protein (DUF1697 family)